MPDALRRRIVDLAFRALPNTMARDFQSGRLPFKLSGLRFEAITEQPPLQENRVRLSERRDAIGNRLPHVEWRPGDMAEANLLFLARRLCASFKRSGIASIEVSDWVRLERPSDAATIDFGHTLGTTRMSNDPRTGVVDANCRVHGVTGLYVAGGSVFPTSGHANPTMTMIALSLRLADQLKKWPIGGYPR